MADRLPAARRLLRHGKEGIWQGFYERTLTPEEYEIVETLRLLILAAEEREDAEERDAWLAAAAAELGAEGEDAAQPLQPTQESMEETPVRPLLREGGMG